jgi:hypothetical protein
MNQGEAKILISIVRLARDALGFGDRLPRHVEHVPDVDEVTLRRCRRCDRVFDLVVEIRHFRVLEDVTVAFHR